MAEDPYRYFRLEAREILDQFGPALLDLEKSGSPEQLKQLLRLAHTLKGAARVVKQIEIADGAHAIEDALTPFRDADRPIGRESVDVVLSHLDAISGRVRGLDSPVPAEATAPGQPMAAKPADGSASAAAARTVRADIAEVDRLLEGIAETHVLLGGLRSIQRSIEDASRLAELITEQHRSAAAEERQSAATAGGPAAVAEDLRRSVAAIERRFGSSIDQIERELRPLRDAAEQLRLVGASALFMALERTARDSAQALAKEILFEASGGDIRMDADVLAIAQGALVQLVRNAVAHGIEAPLDRVAAGKPAAGRVTIDIVCRGNLIVFTCRDDGRGVDLEGVHRAALQRGADLAEIQRLTAQDLINLLLRGGISTSEAVTEIAGRGIGLDVVREASERLGGTVSVTSETGKGTSFTLAAPLSLTSVTALIFEAAGIAAALPLDCVRETLLLDVKSVSHQAAGPTIVHHDRAIPFLWLPHLLGGERLPLARRWPTVIVSAYGSTAAIGVDRLLDTGRAIVHPLPDLAPAASFVAGAVLDAQGTPQLVLHPEGLIDAAQLQKPAAAEPEAAHPTVLIVDDSLTTRMLEQSILEAAGYEVDLAVSAEQALEIARGKRYALFLVDVEMPGMDGFTFVERIRADPALHDIPAVLVTSRAAPEDKQRGRDAGAHGYIVKSEFDQSQLLALIRKLIG